MSESSEERADPGPGPSTEPPILRAEGLVKHYADGDVQALRGVSLAIEAGEFVAITGPSGCGKSTLLHLLGGLDRPTAGEVQFRGQPLSRLDIDEYHGATGRLRLPVVPPHAHAHGRREPADPDVRRPSAPERACRLRRGPAGRGGTGPPEGPPAQPALRRRAPASRHRAALANDPVVLLADEPTGNLDSKSQDEILRLLGQIRERRGLTLVIVTHSQDVAHAAGRRVAMKDGQVV